MPNFEDQLLEFFHVQCTIQDTITIKFEHKWLYHLAYLLVNVSTIYSPGYHFFLILSLQEKEI